MAFFDYLAAILGSQPSGAMASVVVPVAEDAGGVPRSFKASATGLLVDIAAAVLPTGAATAALQAALNALVATPQTPTILTPADATDVTLLTTKGMTIGGAGNLVVKSVAGGAAQTIPVVAGQYFPCQVSRVMAATTATGIAGLS